METSITLSTMVNFLAVLITVGGGITVIYKGIKALNSIHDRMETWDKNTEDIKEVNKKVENAHTMAAESISTLKTELNERIEETHADTDAKLQELKAEQYMIVTCLQAVLDGLHQLNCNGEVTKAKQRLDEYIMQKAHE